MSEINIKSRYVESSGASLLVSFLENELDNDGVSVSRNSMAVKSILPIEFIITATSVFFLNKFVLEPLLGDLAEKWKDKVRKVFRPIYPFKLVVNLTEENFSIESRLGTSHEFTAKIWEIVSQSIEIIKKENLQSEISKIRFLPDYKGNLVIFCIKNEKDIVLIDLDESKTKPLEEGHFLLLSESKEFGEDF